MNNDGTANILIKSVDTIWTKVAGFAPNLVAALVIFLIGYVAARVLRAALSTALKKLRVDELAGRANLDDVLAHAGVTAPLSRVIATMVSWVVILMSLLSAADALGLDQVTKTIDVAIGYLPKVIAATLVLVGGLFAAGLLRTFLSSALGDDGLGRPLSRVVYVIAAAVVVGTAIDQLGVDLELISIIIAVTAGAAGLGLALALGLGARSVAGSVVATFYVRDALEIGDVVEVGGRRGEVIEIGAVHTRIASNGRDILIPNHQLVDGVFEVVERAEHA